MSYFESIINKARQFIGFAPYTIPTNEYVDLNIDQSGNLITRSSVTTDEGSFRESFIEYPHTFSTNCTFINGSNQVVGINTSFLTDVRVGDYIKLSSDSRTHVASILSIEDNTHLTLENNYTGSSSTGTTNYHRFKPIEGTGTSITCDNSVLCLNSGTTSGSTVAVCKRVDYGPLVFRMHGYTSQRLSTQTICFGLQDDPSNPIQYARFKLTGTDSKKIIFETCSGSGNDVQSTLITIPNTWTTSTPDLRYRIELCPEYVTASINGIDLATHKDDIPEPYTTMYCGAKIANDSTPASTTSLCIDTIFVDNTNALKIQSGVSSQPLRTEPTPFVLFPQTSASALNTDVIPPINILGYRSITVQLSGTWVAMCNFKVSMDGVNYSDIAVTELSTNLVVNNTNNNGLYHIPNAGFMYLKVTIVSYVSGTVYGDIITSSEPLPVSASSPSVNLKDKHGHSGNITVLSELLTTKIVRLVGCNFNGTVINSNYWSTSTATGGTVTQGGGVGTLTSTTSNGSTSKLFTSTNARQIISSFNTFGAVFKFTTAGVTNNVRQVGVFDTLNGYFFELTGNTFRIVSRKNGTDTAVTVFNGDYGTTWHPGTYNHFYTINYNNCMAEFVVDGVMLHSINYANGSLIQNSDLPASAYNVNIGATSQNSVLDISLMSIVRKGELFTSPKFAYINSSGTYVLQIGSGVIHRVIMADKLGSVVTIYNNTAASGEVISQLDMSTLASPTNVDLMCAYSTGLTINVSLGTPRITIVYE